MSRGEFYGRLGVANLPSEVKKIWYSRDVEPEPCEPIDTFWSTTTDQDLPIAQDFARKIVEITPLTGREIDAVALCILDSCTLKEAGIDMNCTQERVRQILLKALRKFRKHQREITGIPFWDLDTRDMSYFLYSRERM